MASSDGDIDVSCNGTTTDDWKQRRWYKDVGLGFRTPKTAIEGQYIGM